MAKFDLTKCETMDIFVMSDQAFMSKVVAFFIGKWNHSGIIADAASGKIAHADCGKVFYESMDSMLHRCPNWEVKILRLKPEFLSRFSKKRALEFIDKKQIGKKYGILNAIGRGLYRFMSWFGVSRKSQSVFYKEGELICSVFTDSPFIDQGINVREEVHFTQMEPEDFLASDKFIEIKTLKES